MPRNITPGYTAPAKDLVRPLEDLPLRIPPGSGLRLVPAQEWKDLESLFGYLLIWERPRRDQLYVLSADVSGGTGRDRTCADVTRVATEAEPDEQVAQWVSPFIDPVEFSAVLDVMGRFYTGSDGQPAVCAIETIGFGGATQSELIRHYGYPNLYVWQREDAINPERRFSSYLGWETNRRSRPHMLGRYRRRVNSMGSDGKPDLYRINSPFTLDELKTFKRPHGGDDVDAAADPTNPHAHDDCIMTGAIGVFVAQTLYFEVGEPLDAKRHRLAEEAARREAKETAATTTIEFANQDYTLEEMEDAWLEKSHGLLGVDGALRLEQ
jgi:hypothetical protein